MKNYHRDVMNLTELFYSLENISGDDRKTLKEYTQAEVVAEAVYILGCYLEGGHSLNEDLYSDDPQICFMANEEVKGLRKYIKKYRVKR